MVCGIVHQEFRGRTLNSLLSAGNDRDAFSGRRGKMLKVAGVARKDAVAVRGHKHDGGIDRIVRPCTANKNAGLTTQSLVNRTHIDRAKQSSQSCLTAFWIPPHLSD